MYLHTLDPPIVVASIVGTYILEGERREREGEGGEGRGEKGRGGERRGGEGREGEGREEWECEYLLLMTIQEWECR